ncbi:MAG: M14 family zinc carboxypeptidase [Bacteroidia bacterium]
MVRLILFVTIFTLFSEPVIGQEVYSLVSLSPSSHQEWDSWLENGFTPDHFTIREGNLEMILDDADIALLDVLGASYQILQRDMSSVYARNLSAQATKLSQRSSCGLAHFSPGTMSGYHTWAEAVAQLDSMHAAYPAIISPKIQIGTSVEGRPVWAVKISDNPATNESATEPGVYFDALTHAREPLSLEMILYYMWWLLENYNQNPEATKLVNDREIFFVPVVNPDGYVYNQVTNPNGGGLWRKNRRVLNNICAGIDLNRNFSFGWGLNSGSTGDPCSNTFRGLSAFSEPETQAIENFLNQIAPETGFSIHTYGRKIISPLGYTDSLVREGVYSDFSSAFIPARYNGYGTIKQLFNYESSGTTIDYFHSQGITGWMPEMGGDFWDDPGTICLQLREFLPAMKYITWVAGAYISYQNYQSGEIIPGQNTTVSLRVRNSGLSQIANNVSASLIPLSPGIQTVAAAGSQPTIAPGKEKEVSFTLFISPDISFPDTIRLGVVVGYDGVVTARDTIQLLVGNRRVIFQDDFSGGRVKWQQMGTGKMWDTTSVDRVGGKNYMTDSPSGSYRYDSNSGIVMSSFADLTDAVNPVLEFSTRFSLEPFSDYVKIEVGGQTNNDWKSVGGSYASEFAGQYFYQGNRYWVEEKIDLGEFAGKKIKIRFQLHSGTFVQSDGFYIRDLRIVDYTSPVTSAEFAIREPVFELFPNPAQKIFSLKIIHSTHQPLKMEIMDMNGKFAAVFEGEYLAPGENKWQVNVADYPVGVYLVKWTTEEGIYTRKLLIQR